MIIVIYYYYYLFIYSLLTKCIFFCRIVTKRFRPDLNATHPWDLNFVLRLKIFMHYDG